MTTYGLIVDIVSSLAICGGVIALLTLQAVDSYKKSKTKGR